MSDNTASPKNSAKPLARRTRRKGGRRSVPPISSTVQGPLVPNARKDFVFDKNAAGYSCTELNGFEQENLNRPAYGGYGIAVGELDSRYPEEELVVGIPRAPNATGTLNGQVEK